jgi:hypothetical protein
LTPLAGRFASLLFTLGMVGTGILVVPVLAAPAHVSAQTFKFREGLDDPIRGRRECVGLGDVPIAAGATVTIFYFMVKGTPEH